MSYWGKRFIAVFLAVFLSVTLFVILGELSQRYYTEGLPVAKSGVVDLTSVDVTRQSVPLDGEWNFFPQAFLSSAQISSWLTAQQAPTIDVPHSWDMSDYYETQNSAHGYGTYHLTVTVNNAVDQIAIRLPTIGTAYTLFINDEMLTQVGTPGTNASNTVAAYLPQVISFVPPDNTFDVTLHVANFGYSWGGMWYSINMGAPSVIYDQQQHSLLLSVFLAGFLFAAAAFNLMLYTLRRKDVLPLLVSIICTVLGVRELVLNDILLLHILPDLSFGQILSINYFTFFISVPLLSQFFRSSFPDIFSRPMMVGITLISCLYISVLFTTPVELSSKLIFSFQIFSVFVVMTYLFYVLGMAVKLRKQGAIALMFGYGMLSFAGVNDILYARELGGIGYLMGFGVIVYVLSQLFVTNMRLTAAFGLSEQLGVDLEASNKNLIDLAAKLETTVTERTAELTASNQKLEEMARTDALTGLINRRGVELAIKQEHERFKRSGVAYSVAIIDLDHFKSVNDRFGHGVGDDVLVATASCLASTVRSQDMVVRWGGEEFVIVFPDTDLKGALVVLENIRKAIKESVIQHDQGSLSVTATIGIAEVEPEESFGMCLNRADELLYQGKEDGRDRIVS